MSRRARTPRIFETIWGRLLLAALALSLLAPSLAAQSDGAGEPFPDVLLRKLAARPSATVAFHEVKRVSELTRPLEFRGTLHYRAPDRLEKRVSAPRQESYTIEGDRITIVLEGEEKGQFSLEDHPRLRAFVESIRATLAGDAERLNRYYQVYSKGSLEQWTLTLIPREASLADFISRIEIGGRDVDLERFYVEEVGGDNSLMRISKIGDG